MQALSEKVVARYRVKQGQHSAAFDGGPQAGQPLTGELVLEFPPQSAREIGQAAFDERVRRFCVEAELQGVRIVTVVANKVPPGDGWLDVCPG